jgi:hypothetical protein
LGSREDGTRKCRPHDLGLEHLYLNLSRRIARQRCSHGSLTHAGEIAQTGWLHLNPNSNIGRYELAQKSRTKTACFAPKFPLIFPPKKFSYKTIDTTVRAQTATPSKKSTEKISLTSAQ